MPKFDEPLDTLANCPSEILRHVHNPLTREIYSDNNFTVTYGLWHTLLSAIDRGDLSLELISERPSELADGTLWLSHGRVTGLLNEQNFDYADLPPILFHLVMTATNNLYPNAVGKPRHITSEQSYEISHDNKRRLVRVFSYPITIDALPLNPSHPTPTPSKPTVSI